MLHRIETLSVLIFLVAGTHLATAAPDRSSFTTYPAFGDRLGNRVYGRIESAQDKGLMVELIVRCGGDVTIVTFSKVEKLFCGSSHKCGTTLETAIAPVCH